MSAPLSLIDQLAKHLQREVDAKTRERARLHLLDWLACVAGARGSDVARTGIGPIDIGWHTSLLGNVLEMDDVHRTGRLHPGPVIWPIVLRNTWMRLDLILDAAVRGYEAMIAVGSTLDDYHYSFWHPTTTAGIFGAAAAEIDLLEQEDRMAWALGNAGSVAGGLWHMRHDDVMTKQWHILHAVRTGRDAAWAAKSGVTGPSAILEGPQGLYAATCRDPKPMAFPDQWRIHEVSFKPWAACRHAHPVIDCALELRAAGRLQAPFHVETYGDAIRFCDNPEPKTEVDAKFSLQHAVAVIADGRAATPADFTLEAIAALAPLRTLVTVAEASEITARYPDHFGARVDGLELLDTRGDPERPVGEADVIAKMHMLAEWGGLAVEEAEQATELALRGNDAGAIANMLGEWLA
ncbi:MmgE/PrpD family protein [Sphingorhabdus contaminans]|uniref:MmgE/PrpD family protein n=1 Tax=Sphingorhabdus contaminans TaxID=1343899 RepID=UPI003D28ABD2